MNKYSMVIDPVRSKNFAVIIEKKTGLSFIPLNEMAKDWASKQAKFGSIVSVKVPDGMYVSSPKKLTMAQEVMLEDSAVNSEDIRKPRNTYIGRTRSSEKTSINSVTGQHLRKIPKHLKAKTLTYKALAFKNRVKRSSTISAVKSGSLKLDSKSCNIATHLGTDFGDSSSSSPRRVAASYFLKNEKNSRVARRAKMLTTLESKSEQNKSKHRSIEIAIASKAAGFI